MNEQLLKDIEEGLSLLRSDEWKQYLAFLRRRNQKQQARVNAAVRKADIIQAQIDLALMEDSMRQADIFRQQVLQANANIKKGVKKDV